MTDSFTENDLRDWLMLSGFTTTATYIASALTITVIACIQHGYQWLGWLMTGDGAIHGIASVTIIVLFSALMAIPLAAKK